MSQYVFEASFKCCGHKSDRRSTASDTIPNYHKPYVVLEEFCDNGGGKRERVDVENQTPGEGNGNVYYHDVNNTKYVFDPVDGKFYLDKEPYPEAPPSIQKMLEDPAIQDAINKALKYLGEPPYFK